MMPPRPGMAPPPHLAHFHPPAAAVSSGPTPYIPAHRPPTGPAYYPLTLFIKGFPTNYSDDSIRQIVECCGPLQKWHRPREPISGEVKSYGMFTFREGKSALRCKNVLDGFELPVVTEGGDDEESPPSHSKLIVRGATKEESTLQNISNQERSEDQGGQYKDEADIKAFVDAPVREKVCEMVEKLQKAGRLDKPLEVDSTALEKEPEPYTLKEGDEGYERSKEVQYEIDLFRFRQTARDKEVLEKRKEYVLKKLKELEEEYLKGKDKGSRKDRDSEEEMARKRRKQQTVEMVNHTPAQPQTSAANQSAAQNFLMKQEDQMASNVDPESLRQAPKLVIKSGPSNAKAKMTKNTAAGKFSAEDDDQDEKKARAIIPLDYTAEEEAQGQMAIMHQMANSHSTVTKTSPKPLDKASQEKLKALADAIPATREELFAYPINWEACEKHNIVDSTIRAWVVKKFIEYLGEEEESITNFIVTKLKQRCNPQILLDEISPVLDSDTEPFVLKLWRLLAFSGLKADLS